MRVLLTGSTAAHVSPRKHTDGLTFSGLINEAITWAGHEVVWAEPSVTMTREYIAGFNAVIVGMAPPTSTAAHRIYGALSVIDHARHVGNLNLLIDAPEPKKVWAGLRAIYLKPRELTKDFYVKRQEYRDVAHDFVETARLVSAIEYLYENPWPTTIYPALPWMSFPSVSTYIPQTNAGNLLGLNLDKLVLRSPAAQTVDESNYWVADVPRSRWTQTVVKTIGHPVVPLAVSRWEDPRTINARLMLSIGCLVSTYKYGDPWWSPALVQALSQGVPVVTDWKLSSMLGAPWSVLAATIEDLPRSKQLALADEQRQAYQHAGLPLSDSVGLLLERLFLTK
jgi:hypothetical protein